MINVETVQQIYEAFGTGDVPAILERVDENVEWDTDLPEDGPPWLQPRRGRDAIGGFFQALGENLEIKRFEPYAFLGGENYVVSLIAIDFEVKSTGGLIQDPRNAHLWTFNDDGLVASLRHLADTQLHHRAWKGE